MNLLFISPHFPPNYQQFCRALARHGARVLGIGDTPAQHLSEGLRGCLDDYLFVPNMLDRDAMQRALGLLTHRHGKIDRIDSLNEHWLGIEAELREDFNVFGLKPPELDEQRSKGGMRALFQAHDIPCARGARVSSAEQVKGFLADVQRPIILKPELGVGAGDIYKVHNDEELAAVLPRLDRPYVVEEYLDGVLMSYDGLCDHSGRVLFEHCTEVNSGVLEIVARRGPIHYFSLLDPPAGLIEIGRSIVEAFRMRERFFHIELFRLADGSFRALEVNLRPPGGFSTDMMNYSFDIDVYDLWARVMTQQPLAGWSAERRHSCAHIGRRKHIAYRYDHPTLARALGSHLLMHREMPAAFSTPMGDEVYLIRAADVATVREVIATIESAFGVGL